MPDELALVRLPDPAIANRDSLNSMSHFAVQDFGQGIVAVVPVEGAGTVAPHLTLHRVCDASTNLADPQTWRLLDEHPPRRRRSFESVGYAGAESYRDAMVARGQEIAGRTGSLEGVMVGTALSALGALENGELDELLKVQLPVLFKDFPEGSLWMVSTSDVLLARLAFGRTQLALQLTPDMPIGEDMEELKACSELTLTQGIDVSAVMNVPLVTLSPSVLGFLIPAPPHVLVFCFGKDLELRQPCPTSLASIYRPTVLNDAQGLDRSTFLGETQPNDGPQLLAWWVNRLNVVYSHLTDPTRFADADGYYDAAAHTAWMVTLERLIGDMVSLLAEPQATDLDRLQMAFDLLDKAESLLGYDRQRTGKGFAALLRRGRSVPRLRDALSSLPDDLGARLSAEIERLFDALYEQVRANTLHYRLQGERRFDSQGPARPARSARRRHACLENVPRCAQLVARRPRHTQEPRRPVPAGRQHRRCPGRARRARPVHRPRLARRRGEPDRRQLAREAERAVVTAPPLGRAAPRASGGAGPQEGRWSTGTPPRRLRFRVNPATSGARAARGGVGIPLWRSKEAGGASLRRWVAGWRRRSALR